MEPLYFHELRAMEPLPPDMIPVLHARVKAMTEGEVVELRSYAAQFATMSEDDAHDFADCLRWLFDKCVRLLRLRVDGMPTREVIAEVLLIIFAGAGFLSP